jgi:phosphatidylinositol alpha-mannosyltransferase
LKVAFVGPYDWSVPGGVRSHILGVRAALVRKGVGVEIIAPASRAEHDIYAVGRTIPVPANRSIARINFSRSAQLRIRERLGRGDIDLLHLHEPAIPSTSMLALMEARLPAVATFHAAAERSLGYALVAPLLRRMLERLEERIVVSEAALSLVARYFPGKYRLVPNGVDGSRFRDARPDPELRALKPLVLFVGRPEERKGFGVLLRAMTIIRRTLDVSLVTTGKRPGPRTLLAAGIDPDSAAWVIGLGDVTDERLPGLYAAADVFCAPSLGNESFGLILLEAMAAGTPVVAAGIAGYREAAAGAAELAAPGDSDELAVKITSVLRDSSLASKLRELGRARAAALDWDVLSGELIAVYKRVLDRHMMSRSS